MSTSATQFSEADVDIRNTKETNKNYEMDVNIRNTFFLSGCPHP